MTKVEKAYGEIHADTLELLDRLISRIQDMPAPDEDTRWTNVEEMTYIRKQVYAVIETFEGWDNEGAL